MMEMGEIMRRVEHVVTERMEFQNRALKLVMMRLADAGVSPILTEIERCVFTFDDRVAMLRSRDESVNEIIDRCIVDAAATMLLDCGNRPFPFVPFCIVKEALDYAKWCPLDENTVDGWIAELAVEASHRRAEHIANGELP
jgi:hypothetical protein